MRPEGNSCAAQCASASDWSRNPPTSWKVKRAPASARSVNGTKGPTSGTPAFSASDESSSSAPGEPGDQGKGRVAGQQLPCLLQRQRSGVAGGQYRELELAPPARPIGARPSIHPPLAAPTKV